MKTYVAGTQKNHLNEMVLLAPKTNVEKKQWVRKYSQFYSQNFCITWPMIFRIKFLLCLKSEYCKLHNTMSAM